MKEFKYYRDEKGLVYAYPLDGSGDHLIGDKVRMTDEEVEAHIHPVKTKEDYIAEANAKRIAFLRRASYHIGVLQDAVDLDMATDDEKTLLLAWKKYRVLLSRVDTSTAPDIDWPEIPVDVYWPDYTVPPMPM